MGYDIEKLHTVPRAELETNLDAILEKVDAGGGPVRILGDNGKSYLLFSWEEYMEQFGCLYSAEQLAEIEAASRAGESE